VTQPRTRTVWPACDESSAIREYGEVMEMNRWEERSGGKVDGARMQCQPHIERDLSGKLESVKGPFESAKHLTG
jgi:hypothetical protein